MRLFLLSFLVCLFLAPAAFALEQTPDDGGCGTIDPMSPCYSGSVQTYCTKPYRCPLCGTDANTGATVCFVVYGQPYGHCTCKPKGSVTRDGVRFAVCETSGACRTSR